MAFDTKQGQRIIQIVSADLRAGGWVEEKKYTVKTDPHMTDTGSVTLIRYFPGGYDTNAVSSSLIASKHASSGLYVVSVDMEPITPQILRVICSLEGCCSPKEVKRTFCGNRKELSANNPTYIKKLQAEYPAYEDSWLEGPGISVTALSDPPTPNGYWYTTDMQIINEPFGWVILGDDYEMIPHTPYVRRTLKVQWYWEKEPGN